jgi:hypothetical protein
MTISIDGIIADIRLENERTLGDALYGIEQWVEENGFCVTGISVDGVAADNENMSAIFDREITGVKTLDIATAPSAALYGEALSALKTALLSWSKAGDDRNEIERRWRESPGAAFLSRYDKTISDLTEGRFSDEAVAKASVITAEREAEAGNPAAAFLEMEEALGGHINALLDLPLDFQTGNDRRAAETIELFSDFTQKLLRLIPFIKYAMIEKKDSFLDTALFDEFKSALNEFLAAYENKDMVLCGDLAEYEIAPRIKIIYAELKEKMILSRGGSYA